nr:hypothetical protein [Tanacetum cinerariifolium]
TPSLSTEEPDNSLSMGDEHLDTISATKLDEFIKSSVEDLIPIPSESEGIPNHSDEQSCSDEDVLEKIISKPLFEEEIIPMKIDQHPNNVESALMESLHTHDSSLLRIDETDCDFEEDIRLIEKLLYDNSSPRPPEEFVSANSDAEIKSFSPSPILVKDSDSLMEEIDSL